MLLSLSCRRLAVVAVLVGASGIARAQQVGAGAPPARPSPTPLQAPPSPRPVVPGTPMSAPGVQTPSATLPTAIPSAPSGDATPLGSDPGATRGERLTTNFKSFLDSLSAPPAYTRERMIYNRFNRTDPVTPPVSLLSDHAFPQMTLSGIVYNVRSPSASYAMVRFQGRDTPRQVIHAGDKIDQYTVTAVERNRVVISVKLFGMTKTIYLVPEGKGGPKGPASPFGPGRP